MPDVVSPEVRSRMMSGIRSKNTKLELVIRSGLHKRGFRYRIHKKDFPGKPDLVFRKYNAVIFVHGCFWHKHDCHLFKWPKSREEFWRAKILGNVKRDRIVEEQILSAGWRIGIIWECALKGKTRLSLDDILDECETWLSGKAQKMEIRGQ
ncbi:very short patch repair endonuclease [Kiloniella sp. EL199]|uniref:very short patch repair endonuclease n=1 Tax=Kiloniella sp. EL199 TaxID=2107581 RepID=UPI000EA40923|nr:very short patch repair endonuclease [Kiloniella sp. EL199]